MEVEKYALARMPGYLVLSRGSRQVFAFDREHRLFHAFVDGKTYRVGMDGRVIEVHPRGLERLSEVRNLAPGETAEILERIREWIDEAGRAPDDEWVLHSEEFLKPSEARPELVLAERALLPTALIRQQDEFRRLYSYVPILPPDCYRSLLVQVTQGCHYNRCLFCSLYETQPFKIRTNEEFQQHIYSVLKFQNKAMERWTSVFLGDANALVVSDSDLLDRIGFLRKAFSDQGHGPLAQKLFSFSDAAKMGRTEDEFRELHRAGLRKIYIGLETGCWDLRKDLKKPGTPESIEHWVRTAKKSGIALGIILLAGAGGETLADRHVSETLEVVGSFPLDSSDIIFVSPLRLHAEKTAAAELPLSDHEIWEQAQRMMKEFRVRFGSKGPKTAIYDVARFIY